MYEPIDNIIILTASTGLYKTKWVAGSEHIFDL